MKRYKFYIMFGVICSTCFACSSFLTEYSHDQAYVQSYTDLDEIIIGSGYMKCNSASYDYGYTKDLVYYPYIHFMADETEVKTTGAYSYSNANVLKILFGYYTWQKKWNVIMSLRFNGLKIKIGTIFISTSISVT